MRLSHAVLEAAASVEDGLLNALQSASSCRFAGVVAKWKQHAQSAEASVRLNGVA